MEEGQKGRMGTEAADAGSEESESALNEPVPVNISESGENEEDESELKSQRQESPSVASTERHGRRKVQRRKMKEKEQTGVDLSKQASFIIVREVYDGGRAYEFFERELEWALEAAAPAIIIEPYRLGDETARWIAVGNCLHKGGVIAGAASLLAGTFWPSRPVLYIPTCICSALCTSLYMFSWCLDPCCKYQVETDPKRLASILPLHLLSTSSTPPGWIGRPEGHTSSSSSSSSMNDHPSSTSPIVLVRKDDTRRKVLHSTVTLCAVLLCAYRLYYTYK